MKYGNQEPPDGMNYAWKGNPGGNKNYYTGSEKYPPPGILFTPAINPLIHGAKGVKVGDQKSLAWFF